MAYQRISRSRKRELEQPDEFITVSSQIVRFISDNTKQIVIGIIVIIILGVVFSGLQYYAVQTEKAAQASLKEGLDKYERVKKRDTTPKNIYQELKPDFEAILKKYPNKDAATNARLIYADICFNAKEYDSARGLYARLVKDFEGQPFYSNLARKNLAYAYEEIKDYQEAIDHMEQVLEQPEVKMKDEVLFNLGRLYAVSDQKEKEVENYKKIIAEFPNSEYSNVVREKLMIGDEIN